MYSGICQLNFYDRVFAKRRNLYANNMVSLDLAKLGWNLMHGLMDTVTRTKRIFRFFATVYNLMKIINMIDSCQEHMPMLRTSNSFDRSDTDVVMDSEPHLILMCKTNLLFTPSAVSVHNGCSAFPFYTPRKLLI